MEKSKAVLKFFSDRERNAGEIFLVQAQAGTLFRAERFIEIESAEKLALVNVFVDSESQRPADSTTPTPFMVFLGIGADMKWDTCDKSRRISLVLKTLQPIKRFRCTLQGYVPATEVRGREEPVDITEVCNFV